MATPNLFYRLAIAPPIRWAADWGLRQLARYRVAALDQCQEARVQERTLLRLIRQARATRFGRDHHFDRVQTVRDYQKHTPLRDYSKFWVQYWQPAFPILDHVTWPGRIPYLALSSGTTSGSTKYIPISASMIASNQRAALTTLAFFLSAFPSANLLGGRFFFLGGSTDLAPRAECVLAGDLSGIAARELAAWLRPFTFPSLDLALRRDWTGKLQALAERSAGLPITALSGVPSWLLVLFERLLQVTGRTCIADIWPTLALVIHGGTKFDPYRQTFRQAIGSDGVQFLEVYPASEGYVGTEDPRYGLLRLIPDHGLFFEFVPVDELDQDLPARHTVADLVPGVQYAVVLTTCAGLWSYVLGDTVCFAQRHPPLFRFTGRTHYFLSAFGEHLISEEIEQAIAQAAAATGALVADFHVGPVFPEVKGTRGRHRYLVEFVQPPADLECFARELDQVLCRINEDYQAHRRGDLTMLAPEVCLVPRGGFADWLGRLGKVGGQHKVPRMDNSGQLTEEFSRLWIPVPPNHP